MTERKKIKVLITPAGSRIAIPIIKFLKKTNKIKVISADIDKLAAGLYLSDKGYLISPFSKEKKFLSDLKKIIIKENIDILIPALDPLLIKFARLEKYFQKLGIRILVSPLSTLLITRDKWKTYQFLNKFIPMPKSFIKKENINLSYPFFIKPRLGSGSLNVFKINSREELDFYFKRIKKPIIQEYLEGREYTVDCLTDLEGKLLFCIPRERLETKAGVSIKGKIVKNKKIEKIALKISEKLKFRGPFFFQLKENREKVLMLTEINARFGGGMPLSCAAGPNIYLLSVKLFMGEEIRIPKIKRNLYFTRFDEELYLTEERIKTKIKKI